MKINKSRLQKVIQEEMQSVLNEQPRTDGQAAQNQLAVARALMRKKGLGSRTYASERDTRSLPAPVYIDDDKLAGGEIVKDISKHRGGGDWETYQQLGQQLTGDPARTGREKTALSAAEAYKGTNPEDYAKLAAGGMGQRVVADYGTTGQASRLGTGLGTSARETTKDAWKQSGRYRFKDESTVPRSEWKPVEGEAYEETTTLQEIIQEELQLQLQEQYGGGRKQPGRDTHGQNGFGDLGDPGAWPEIRFPTPGGKNGFGGQRTKARPDPDEGETERLGKTKEEQDVSDAADYEGTEAARFARTRSLAGQTQGGGIDVESPYGGAFPTQSSIDYLMGLKDYSSIYEESLQEIIQEELQNMLQEGWFGESDEEADARRAAFDVKVARERKAKKVGAGSRLTAHAADRIAAVKKSGPRLPIDPSHFVTAGIEPIPDLYDLLLPAGDAYVAYKEMEGEELVDPQRRSSGDTKIIHVSDPKHAENI